MWDVWDWHKWTNLVGTKVREILLDEIWEFLILWRTADWSDQAAQREDPSRVFSLEFQIVFTYILSGKHLTTDADPMKGVNHAFPRAMNLWGFVRQWLWDHLTPRQHLRGSESPLIWLPDMFLSLHWLLNLKDVWFAQLISVFLRNLNKQKKVIQRKINGLRARKKKFGSNFGGSFQILESCTFSKLLPRVRRGWAKLCTKLRRQEVRCVDTCEWVYDWFLSED